MTELGDLWEKYQALLNSGVERNNMVREIESKIHAIQKEKGWARYDFDKRWSRKEIMSQPTLEGPPDPQTEAPSSEEIAPTANFTFEQAKKRVGENNYNIMEDCAMDTECEMICLAEIHERLNPENKNNLARRGQAINLTSKKYNKLKEDN